MVRLCAVHGLATGYHPPPRGLVVAGFLSHSQAVVRWHFARCPLSIGATYAPDWQPFINISCCPPPPLQLSTFAPPMEICLAPGMYPPPPSAQISNIMSGVGGGVLSAKSRNKTVGHEPLPFAPHTCCGPLQPRLCLAVAVRPGGKGLKGYPFQIICDIVPVSSFVAP